MNREEVEAILGPPDETVTVTGAADLALVWKEKKLLFITETVIVAFSEGQSKMLTHSSGPIFNVREHVEESLADGTELGTLVPHLRRIQEVERFDGIYEMRTDVAAMINHLEVSGEDYFEVDPESAARFDSIDLGLTYDDVTARFGQPHDADSSWGKTSGSWHWNGDTMVLDFKDQILISKAFKTAGREALVEEGRWQASAGRTRVTVIED